MKRYAAIIAVALAPFLLVACDSGEDGDSEVASIDGIWYEEGDSELAADPYLIIQAPFFREYDRGESEEGEECWDVDDFTLERQPDRFERQPWAEEDGRFVIYVQEERLHGYPDDNPYLRTELTEEEIAAQLPECGF